MKKSLENGWNSFLKLFRFLAWYGVAVVTLMYLLPIVGLLMEAQYDLMSSTAKFFSVMGFIVVVSAWYISNTRDRMRETA